MDTSKLVFNLIFMVLLVSLYVTKSTELNKYSLTPNSGVTLRLKFNNTYLSLYFSDHGILVFFINASSFDYLQINFSYLWSNMCFSFHSRWLFSKTPWVITRPFTKESLTYITTPAFSIEFLPHTSLNIYLKTSSDHNFNISQPELFFFQFSSPIISYFD